ncbi:OmpA family protein [Siphonobacter sp.]|uniref:OmpA family protein n=1 Tax=Siphonobacter sp. TaxID=1869184 RepID=UPI003B3A68B4
MKKRLLFSLIGALLLGAVQAQVTVKPRVEGQTAADVFITKVELTSQFTIVYMRYEDPPLNIQDRWLRKLNPQMQETSYSNVAVDPESDLRVNQKGNLYSFKFIKAVGIPVRPDKRDVQPGDVINFAVYFERLEPGMEDFDLFECRDRANGWRCWNFYHIHIKNPADKTKKDTKAPAVAQVSKKTPEVATVLLSGQVYDAVTKEPLEGKITVLRAGAKADTLRTIGSTGVFRKNVRPGSYQLSTVVPGYETMTATVTVKDNAVEKDFYLRTGKKQSAPAVAPPVATAPVKPTPPPATTSSSMEDLKAEVGSKIELKNILFETGKAVLLTESQENLTQVVAWMKKNPTVEIRLEGHTDAIGDSQKNMELSIERVETVKRYLVNNGINASRIEAKGFGDTRPLSTAKSDQERKVNRRVELIVTKK